MPTKLYNVFLSTPTPGTQDWDQQADLWNELRKGVSVDPQFHALTLKAIYVIGLVVELCDAVSILLSSENLASTTFYPAYVVFASAIELLGRHIRGNATIRGNGADLETGFKWLKQPSASNYDKALTDQALVTGPNHAYTIGELVALRNFSAHGQATLTTPGRGPDSYDYLLLNEMPPLVATGVENYLSELRSSEALCNQLAKAKITPLRSRPLFDGLWNLQADEDNYPSSVGRSIRGHDWTYKSPLKRTNPNTPVMRQASETL